MWLAQAAADTPISLVADTERIDLLIVLIGVILGLSIGRMVNFMGDFLFHRRNGIASLTHGLFLAAMFLFQVFYWWGIWDLKTQLIAGGVNFWIFTRMLLIPLCLYCATALLCPKLVYPTGDEKLSMATLFDDHCRPFYLFWFGLCVIGISQGMDLRGESWNDPDVYVRTIAGGLFLIGSIAKNSKYNAFLSFLIVGILFAYITVPLWEPYWPIES